MYVGRPPCLYPPACDTSLRRLDLGGDEGLIDDAWVAAVLQVQTALECLSISNIPTRLTDATLQTISQQLAGSLVELSMMYCALGCTAAGFEECAQACSQLRSLRLAECSMSGAPCPEGLAGLTPNADVHVRLSALLEERGGELFVDDWEFS